MDPNQPQTPPQYPQTPPAGTPPPQFAPAPPATSPYPPQQAAQPTVAPQPAATPFATQPAYAAGTDETASIAQPKYWLSVIGIIIAYSLLSRVPIIGSLVSLVWIAVLIITVMAATNMKSGPDMLTEKDKYKMVLLMGADPMISQAIYYYTLKKQLPRTAKKALSMGWKIFGIQILIAIIMGLVLKNLGA